MKAFVFGIAALAGLFVAAPAMAQTYNPSYYYPQFTQPQYTSTSYYGYGNGCPNISYNLTLGSSDYTTGGQVSQLQNFLRSRYNDSRLTGGYYGQLTSYYVTRFQQENGVYPATGGVGPLTRQAIARVCGGGYNPGYPTPSYRTTTFRLDRDFSLEVGETGKLRNEELTITLNQVVMSQYGYGYYYNQEPQAVRITVVEGCSSGTYCFYAPSQSFVIEEDDDVNFRDWNIEVKNLDRDEATFRVTERDNDNDNDNNDEDGTIEVSAPQSHIEVEQGDDMDIEWSVDDEPRNASVVLDLYDEDDDRVGTIAIVDADEEEYEWDVPEGGDICTLQFPNGLCGHDLDGDYYIKAILREGSNGSGDKLDEDNSHIFTIED